MNLLDVADVPAGTHSFDLSAQASGTFYIKAVGKASFQNKMSPEFHTSKAIIRLRRRFRFLLQVH